MVNVKPDENLWGVNWGDKIHILYREWGRKTLGHELLHSVFKGCVISKEWEEWFVRDMANYDMVYKPYKS